MTLDEYNAKMHELEAKLSDSKVHDDIIELQYDYMTSVLDKFDHTDIVNTTVGIIVHDIMYSLIYQSQTGNVIKEVGTKKLAHEVDTCLWENFSDYLLDAPQIYKNDNGKWNIDCMFGGYYCPDWEDFSLKENNGKDGK